MSSSPDRRTSAVVEQAVEQPVEESEGYRLESHVVGHVERHGAGPWGGIELGTEPEGTSVVRLWGEVDAGLRDEASVVMAQVVLRAGPVVVDATDLTFIDSTGLAFVLQLVKAGCEVGRDVILRDPPARLVELIDVARVRDLIPVRHTEPAHG